jgi:hypothetical protein
MSGKDIDLISKKKEAMDTAKVLAIPLVTSISH